MTGCIHSHGDHLECDSNQIGTGDCTREISESLFRVGSVLNVQFFSWFRFMPPGAKCVSRGPGPPLFLIVTILMVLNIVFCTVRMHKRRFHTVNFQNIYIDIIFPKDWTTTFSKSCISITMTCPYYRVARDWPPTRPGMDYCDC